MITVHVIRKPLSEGNVASNVFKWGTGALNIKASKIAYPSGKPESGWAKTGSKGESGYLGESNFRIRNMSAEEIQARVSDGRWPANLLLQHKAGCQQVGSQHVVSNGHFPSQRTPNVIYGGGKGTSVTQVGGERYVGTETIPKWECVTGCPVADMDDISGVRASGSGAVKRASASDKEGNRSAAYGAESRPEGQAQVSHGDKGGASRFFKHFQEDPE